MSVFLFALALFAAEPDVSAVSAQAAEAPPAPGYPVGAPRDDYGLVAWCYGALGGYLDLHDEVMPEVTRIETTWRRPGSNLQDDLKVYADMQKEGRANLKLFSRAIEAAEKASLKPISVRGAEAVKKGRSGWAAAATLPKARVAQEWMSWSLPAVCISTAGRLETSAKLLGATFDPSQGEPAVTEERAPPEAAPPQAGAESPPPSAEPAPEIPPGDSMTIDSLLDPAPSSDAPADSAASSPGGDSSPDL